jgi:hypothetical protein
MKKEQTVNEIVDIISSVIETEITGGFTTHRMPGVDEIDFWGDEYYEGDLTKSYLKLVKDIFNLKYGEINREVIECFGDTIRTNRDQFKSSYKTTIKEIIPEKVYIHTSMNKLTLRKMINSLAKSLDFKVTHRYSKSEQDEKIVNETLNRITSNSDLPF